MCLLFWILVGVGVIGLPQIAVRAMSYKDSKAMHKAIIIGTFVIGTIMFGMHLIGVLARAVIPGIEIGDELNVNPYIGSFAPLLAGIVLSAPIVSIMSTVNALFIMVSSTVVKDIYLNFIKKDATEKQIKNTSLIVTTIIGLAVLLFALNPPDLLVWLIFFFFGSLEYVFIYTVFGLYWSRGNKYGACISMIVGMGSYIVIDRFFANPFGLHTVILPILLSLVTFILGSILVSGTARRQS